MATGRQLGSICKTSQAIYGRALKTFSSAFGNLSKDSVKTSARSLATSAKPFGISSRMYGRESRGSSPTFGAESNRLAVTYGTE